MTEVTFIGKLLEGGEQRDAIHIAVAPVIAGERLRPGQHIGFYENSDDQETVRGWLQGNEHAIGIVDPFLPHQAEKGERFWLFLYQHTITSLRHNWTHPAFSADVVTSVEVKSGGFNDKLEKAIASKEASEKWLRDFIDGADCPDYDTVIAAAIGDHDKNYGEDGYLCSTLDHDYLYFGGRDAHGTIPAEFWDHVEIVTGKKVPKRAAYFSCSC